MYLCMHTVLEYVTYTAYTKYTHCLGLLKKKNQFKNENISLQKENRDLRTQVNLLEEKLTKHQVCSSMGVGPFLLS